jgi:UDP-galactopyranose mutase
MTPAPTALDLVAFSHLRWDFVFQRPQHLLTCCARYRRVYFVEEPVYEPGIRPMLDVSVRNERLFVAVPHLPTAASAGALQTRAIVDELISSHVGPRFIAWYYTPMALEFSRHLKPALVVYDCMDELAHFKSAPPQLRDLEGELFGLADVVFAGGYSLYEHKRTKHPNVHPFPSSVDCAHFRAARALTQEPEDQRLLPRPRIGYAGVIDERFDVELMGELALARPDWHFVLIGPVAKIDPERLARGRNLHYLGFKRYAELPAYFAGWNVAILPFARNESTRFISPTKMPEYLAAGRRVVSTAIRDVVRSYGEPGLAAIVDDTGACIAALERALKEPCSDPQWLARVDAHLESMSWERTFHDMWRLVEKALAQRASRILAPAAHPAVPAALPMHGRTGSAPPVPTAS